MCRRCVCDILTLVYVAECSPTIVRGSALFGDISPMVLATKLFAYVDDHLQNYWRMAALPW